MDCMVDLVIQLTIVFIHLLKLNIQCGVLMWELEFVLQLGLYSYVLCV